MQPSILTQGTRRDKKAARHLRTLVMTCTQMSVVVFMVGSTSLQSWNFSEIRLLRPQLCESYVRWCNLGVCHDDGFHSSVLTRVWCNIRGMPDLGECKYPRHRHAADACSDRENTFHGLSPARFARSCVLGYAFARLVLQILDTTSGGRPWTSQTRPELNMPALCVVCPSHVCMHVRSHIG